MTAKAIEQLRFGCDPELFIGTKVTAPDLSNTKKKTHIVTPVPIVGKVGGTKESPLELTSKLPGWEGCEFPKGAKIQEDGCALEFNTAAASSMRLLTRDVLKIVQGIENFLGKKGFSVVKSCSANFTQKDKVTFPQAFVVGCDPDVDAYTNMQRIVPDAVMNSLMRHAGGHIHIGYDKELIPPNIVIQFMDLVLGLPSVLLDKQGIRRQFYGQAGAHRVKSYGVEYRTLSNFWLPTMLGNWEATQLFLSSAELAMQRIFTDMGEAERLHGAIKWEDVRGAISTENTTMAKQILGFAAKLSHGIAGNAFNFCTYAEDTGLTKKAGK